MLEKYLQDFGLSDKEAQVYVALLAVDNDSVLDLAKKTKINRTTIYLVLESLMKKGLVSEAQLAKKTHYQAESPERLETYIERQKVVLEEQSKKVKDLIPQLKSVQRESGERPVVKYFEGREGIISSMEDFFGPKDEPIDTAYFIYPRHMIEGLFDLGVLSNLRKKRLDKKVPSKALYTYKNGLLQSESGTERIKIDEDKYPLSCDIAVYKNRVKINILKGKLGGISIESQEFADTIKSLFKLAFDNLSRK